MIKCDKCKGAVFLDRTFTDNKNYEVFCILCGKRTFVSKGSSFGQWLDKQERAHARGF